MADMERNQLELSFELADEAATVQLGAQLAEVRCARVELA